MYSFGGFAGDGYGPFSTLVRDAKGNLYGTAFYGGAYNHGTVFEISPSGTETVLYNFAGKPDGARPGAGLVRDGKGNLYGTTGSGGTFGYGTVFMVTPRGLAKVLYSFTSGADGGNPYAGLVRDTQGNLYGTTFYGGNLSCNAPYGCGTVFELTAAGGEKVLHNFGDNSPDGIWPLARLVRDATGNLYGTTEHGGTYGYGTVFKLTPAGTETVLYSFTGGEDGNTPGAGLIWRAGNLYGTTSSGGTYGYGTVFKVTNKNAVVLHSFGSGADGADPLGDLVSDAFSNLYGTTQYGGTPGCINGCGTVFEITPSGSEIVLYRFGQSDGEWPLAGLVLDTQGDLYGTTRQGGAFGGGTVFKVAP